PERGRAVSCARRRSADAAVRSARAPVRAADPARPARRGLGARRAGGAQPLGARAWPFGSADRRAPAPRLRRLRGCARAAGRAGIRAQTRRLTTTMGEPLEHILRVRYGECDLQGVVFNAHYLNFFDTSITELWRSACGSYQAMLDRGVDVVLAEATLRFRKPARFDEELTLAVAVTHIGTTSVITRHTASHAS